MPASSGEPPSEPLPAPLLAALRGRTDPAGFLPFDRFMDVALYGAGVGYYTRPRSPFGPEGDYYTAPRVHPLFARTLAAHVAAVRAALGPPPRFALTDLGSGDGELLAGIVRSLAERNASDGLACVVVDRAPARRSAALERVAPATLAAGARARAAASLAEAGPRTGVVVAHELLDAQPARRFRWDGSAWLELGYRLDGGRLVPAETARVASVPPPGLPVLGHDAAGTVLDVAPAAEAIVREVADHLEAGLLLVVDFGAEEAELVAGHPRGTVAAVRAHRPLPFPTTSPGEADLSAFVNFTRVRHAAGRAGLVDLGTRSQAEALGAWGFAGELDAAVRACRTPEEEVRLRLAAKNLLFGFGNFRVLELAAPASAGPLRMLSATSPAGSS